MTFASSSTVFTVVFTLFVVAVVVLIVLTLRFLIGQARRSKAEWLAEQAADTEDEEAEEAEEEEYEDEEMTVLVLAGGSTRGAIQIGMTRGGFARVALAQPQRGRVEFDAGAGAARRRCEPEQRISPPQRGHGVGGAALFGVCARCTFEAEQTVERCFQLHGDTPRLDHDAERGGAMHMGAPLRAGRHTH